MHPGPLSHRVAGLCREVGPRLGAPTGAAVAEVERRLGEPLRVAIAGRLKAGKSTLVNALIGRRVAPTEVGECTRVVTLFRYGTADRVEVVRRDGSRVRLPLDETGMIPRRLGVPQPEVAHVEVTLTSDRLQAVTVVDTPGLSSTNAAVSDGSRRFLLGDGPLDESLDGDSQAALTGAEAIIYVFTQAVREDDVDALEAFRAMSTRWASNPVNSLGLFNKADKLVAGGDPWPVASPLAVAQARALRRQVADVIPVVGLLAESTEAGRLTARDCESLRELAALPYGERAVLLASVDLFTSRDCAVAAEQRQRLLALLDLYGIAFAIAALTAEPGLATGELVRRLYLASGFPQVRQVIDQTFRWRSDAIKSRWALTRLDHIAARSERPGDRAALRTAVEQLVQQPEYHQLHLLDVVGQVTSGTVELLPAMEAELTRLALSQDPAWVLGMVGAPPAVLSRSALEAATRWRTFAVADANPAQARVAHVAHRGFFLLSQRLRPVPGRR